MLSLSGALPLRPVASSPIPSFAISPSRLSVYQPETRNMKHLQGATVTVSFCQKPTANSLLIRKLMLNLIFTPTSEFA